MVAALLASVLRRSLYRREHAKSLLAVVWLSIAPATLWACPFCTTLRPTLAERRDSAAIAAIGELAARGPEPLVRVHRVLTGEELEAGEQTQPLPGDSANLDSLAPGALAALFAVDVGRDERRLRWEFEPLDELSYAYLLRAPDSRTPAAERLAYYIPYLEHPNALVAEDAYQQFAHADYDEVATVADHLPYAKLRRWLVSDGVPEHRKGLYGVALGLARDDRERAANAAALRHLIDAESDDFRAGFDGALGGYLTAAGEPALAHVEERFLSDPTAARGDVLHALAALRFYYEFGPPRISHDRLKQALRRLLARPDVAPMAVVDLARWSDWEARNEVLALFANERFPQPSASRAVVGYLLNCPEPWAADELARLRRQDPQRVRDAEESLGPFGAGR